MTCENQVGTRNILITFTDCDSGQVYPPISHELAGDDQPMYKLCPYTNEPLPGGFVKRNVSNSEITLTIIRDGRIPLALYQGCGAIDMFIEHYNGRTVTGIGGTATGDDNSDGHEVSLTVTFPEVDEFLPTVLEAVA